MGLKFNPLILSGLDFTGSGSSSPTIGGPVVGSDHNSVLIADNSGNLADIPLTNGQIVIGSTSGTLAAATITGTSNQVVVTNGANSITLSLPQSIATTSSPTFANLNLSPSGAIDITSSGTLALGTTNASIINIGNSGAIVNIQGTTLYENVTQLQVKDPLITLNKGGGVGSASTSGIELEENSIITGYVETSADRNSWTLKAPGQTGIATISPGSSGITLDQSSHDPVTLGTAGSTPNSSAASLSSQVLTLQPANGINPGIVSTTTQTFAGNKTFTGSISASNISGTNTGDQTITLTGDITGSGTGSFATTLATVNSNVGSFNTLTVNAKGQVTAASNTSYEVPLTFSTGLTRSTNTITVNTSQNIATLSNLTSNGFVKTSGGTGTLSIDTTSYVTTVTADIVPTSWASLANNTANQTITGLAFATTVSSFDALLNVYIDATTDTFTTVKLTGTRKSLSDWATNDPQFEFVGDSIPGLAFNITTAGQVQITIGSTTGFISGTVKFRAITI